MDRINVKTNAPWEERFAYSRAVRIGNIVEVTGTAAVDENGLVVYPGNAYKQAKFIFEKIRRALEDCGCGMNQVSRTRMYVTDIALSDEVGKAHKETFDGIFPASTMVEVAKLIDENMLVEIEASAVIY